jgi:hypothetical protein
MKLRFQALLVTGAAFAFCLTAAQASAEDTGWQEEFGLEKCTLKTTGRNQYFVLEPGYQLVLESDDTKLEITVADETKDVNGVATRVVEEKEWKDGKLYEISKNYFAVCEQTNDVYYFGEDVDFYENGQVVKHDGTWLAGLDGSKAGLIMPATPVVGMKYYQEIAPGVAMDRAEVVSIDEKCETPAGTFSCLKVKEGSALNLTETEYKLHAQGIGLVGDEDLKLVKHGFVEE